MLVFWVLAAFMTAMALAIVLVPLLKPRRAAGRSAREVNLEVLRSQRREIDRDVALGTLPDDARAEALDELVGRAERDLSAEEPAAAPQQRRPWAVAIAAAIVIPAIVFGMYTAVGNPRATDPELARPFSGMSQHDVVAMVDKLAAKVRERPDDAQGWSLYARSTAALGRFGESAEAYEHLAKLVPNDPDVLADWADALGMAQGQSLAGRPRELIGQALALDPAHRKALALAGTAAMDAGDYSASAKYWQTLADQVEGSQDEAQVKAILAEVREKAAAAGKPIPAAAKVAKAAPPAGKSVTGSVSVAPQIASKITGTETLFIFARAENGPRVPLAVVRASARELPMKFALDDSQSMAPGMNISSAQALRIEARISRAGKATPEPGDLEGASAVVKPGARDVAVVIDKVVP
jgi:cytochrome c-type biogenesis protein CcmH